MHVLPRVRELEDRFPDTLTVIGVHAGKFVTERVTERISDACDRLGVVHAVVNDRQFRVWRDYAVDAWPTVAVVDPEGYIAHVESGEFSVDGMGRLIDGVIARAETRGTLVKGPGPAAPTLSRHEGALRFPTRAILSRGRLWVADTGHGRVLECAWDPTTLTADVRAAYDGFVEPRGLAEARGHLFVADRAGHAIWRLGDGNRSRVAGTGTIGEGAVTAGPAVLADLRSPWGVAPHAGGLAVAMAGTHQLWHLDLAAETLTLLAGTGGEAISDGPALRAALAQPTGLAASGDALAFTDCESSAVRVLSPPAVATLAGTGLFEFGDRPGFGDEAQLQHCEDVAVHGTVLAVADTYNDRLKRIDPVTRECTPWIGKAGQAGALREPGGVWSDGSTLIVADTGNHRIVSVAADGSLSEVAFAGAIAG